MTSTADAARQDPIPAWVAYLGVAGVGATALFVLAYYQHEFAERFARMPWLLSWTFSIGLDLGSAVAGVFWFFGVGALAIWGRTIAITLVLGSTVLTCISWGLIAGWPYAPLGVIHPLVAFAMAKLLTLWQADRARRHQAVDALDAYRDQLEQQRTAVTAQMRLLTQATIAAAAAAAADREATASDLESERMQLDAYRDQLEQRAAELREQARPRPTLVPRVTAAPVAGGDHQPRPPQAGMVEQLLIFIRDAQREGRAYGQRPAADHLGVSRDKVRIPLEVAKHLLGLESATSPEALELLEQIGSAMDEHLAVPHVNGQKYPSPTAGA